MISKLVMASISDVHLGHNKTRTVHILDNLRFLFPDSEETGRLDLIVIAGDLFDRLLYFSAEEIREITLWIHELLTICVKHDIVLRVLEGTPSHDWKQSKMFETINSILPVPADMKYVDTLSIEYIERFGMNVLYIPDEWAPEADDIWKQTMELMQQRALTHVDIAVMHGAFDYQIPMGHNCHLPDRYMEIVRRYIFIGHVHQHTVYERILAQGSFDRLCHGDEWDKGYIRATLSESEGDSYELVINPKAKWYKTIDLRGMTVEDALNRLERLDESPMGSHFRIHTNRQDAMTLALATVKDRWPQFYWTSLVDDLDSDNKPIQRGDVEIPRPPTITRENIVRTIKDRLPDNLEPRVEQEVWSLLDALI